jgi:hypothetical protein
MVYSPTAPFSMTPSTTRPTTPSSAAPATTIALNRRSQYSHCHIQVPNEAKPIAAIEVNGLYYSFTRCLKDPRKAQEIADRLVAKGYPVVITKIPRGYAIWTGEPEAICQLRPPKRPATHGFCKMLAAQGEYQPCQIQVPDLDKSLTAIVVNGIYYALQVTESNQNHAFEIGSRLSQRGDNVMITQHSYGYSIWVHEPDATRVG